MSFEPVRDTLLSVPGVRAIHELHLWSLTFTHYVASAHLAIGESMLAPASYFPETFLLSPPTFQTQEAGLNYWDCSHLSGFLDLWLCFCICLSLMHVGALDKVFQGRFHPL